MIHVSQQQLSNCISMISRGISTQIDENKQNVNLKKSPRTKKKDAVNICPFLCYQLTLEHTLSTHLAQCQTFMFVGIQQSVTLYQSTWNI